VETDNKIGDLIKAILAGRSASSPDWAPVIIIMADYMSTVNERLERVERLVEKLDSARENAGPGLSIG